VPLICAALDGLILRTSLTRIVQWLGIWLIPAAGCIWLAAKVQPIPANLIPPPILARPLVAADSVGWYLLKLVDPLSLTIDYSRTPAAVLQRGWAQWLALLALAAAIGVICTRRRFLIAGGAIFLAALLPVLGLTPFIFQIYSTVADRYVYLAMLGPAMMLAALLVNLRLKNWLAPAAILTAMLMVLSVRQTFFWRDTPTLFSHAIDLNPTSLAGNYGLGFYWAQQGDDQRAAGFYEQALQFHPDSARTHFNYANLLQRHGLLDAALQHYQQAIALDDSNASYFLNEGIALAMAGKNQEALAAFTRASELAPNDASSYQNAGLVLERLGDITAARQAFEEALKRDPSRSVAKEHLKRLSGG
jgi:tetratricopeptide (TPR) repeat protein